ncbi:MAG: PAS domain S-box protein [Candidatus Omnitrophica bacterium]|nr:PAS domain S-box protein [Candidatus Omnitrophota bacterium]
MGYLTDRQVPILKKLSEHPLVYSLALGIYCTTWTYYGSVGKAATTGMVFLSVYIGSTLSAFLWFFLLKKLIRIKQIYRITSIADFISARYNRSELLAALVTSIAVIGLIPYGALQIKASFSTFEILIQHLTSVDARWATVSMIWLLMGLMIFFSIIFGARKINPTEPSRGLLLAVAIQSLVQLLALLTVGVYVTFFLHNGINDLLGSFSQMNLGKTFQISLSSPETYLVWTTYLLLGMSAIIFLPRQFHVSVIENIHEDHIYTAAWAFPLYMFLITIFVAPIAASGLLQGLPESDADKFVLILPLMHQKLWLAVVVFLGGLSAAVSMIMISSVTLATMITNHIFVPVIHIFGFFNFLKKHLLTIRWIIITCFIFICFLFEHGLKNTYMLVNMGMISFAAVLQFAPCMVGGLYWRRGNRLGALWGLSSGFCLWFYTLMLPALIKSNPLPHEIAFLGKGPWGVSFLKPEQLFGLEFSNSLVNGVFWSLLINITFYIFFSLIASSTKEDDKTASSFVDILKQKKERTHSIKNQKENIPLANKVDIITKALTPYFHLGTIEKIITECLLHLKLDKKNRISLVDLAEIRSETEKILTGYMGAATAYKILKECHLFNKEEAKQLALIYSQIIADFELSPEELLNKVDYYKEKKSLFLKHAEELKIQMIALKASEKKYRTLVQNIDIGVYRYTPGPDGHFVEVNPAMIKMIGYARSELMEINVANVYQDPQDRQYISKKMIKKNFLKNEKIQLKKKDGTLIWASVSAVVIEDDFGHKFYDGTIEDITERKKAQEALQRAKDELEQRVKERTKELRQANDQLQADIIRIKSTETELKQTYSNLKDTQRQLIQSEKLASIGQLAAGVAHEINNPLAYINANIYNLDEYFRNLLVFLKVIKKMQEDMDDPYDDHPFLKTINEFDREWNIEYKVKDIQNIIEETLEGINRISTIVNDLKTFARKDDETEEEVNINDILESSINVAWNQIKYKAELIKNFSDLPKTQCNKLQIGQVFVNMLINSVQAIEDHGKITIATGLNNNNIIITIADTGQGIQKEYLDKVWNPFFTTKEIGQGTGLGLSISYEIIRKHGGQMEIASKEGCGTTFTITLPVKKAQKKGDT